MLVGSANLTARGLGYLDNANVEILCEPAPSFDAATFESGILTASRLVSDEEFGYWEGIESVPLPPDFTIDVRVEDTASTWKPSTRDPEHVWLLYNGMALDIVSEDERRLAADDLKELNLPTGVSRETFDLLVRTHLLASPFVESVRGLESIEQSEAWRSLASEWSISDSDAARSLETVRSWLASFLADFDNI